MVDDRQITGQHNRFWDKKNKKSFVRVEGKAISSTFIWGTGVALQERGCQSWVFKDKEHNRREWEEIPNLLNKR